MNNSTITDYFNDQLELLNIDVTDAIYTTYGLDIGFFETEILPLLFTDEVSFSNDGRIKELQVREKLEETKIAINLFYDSNCDEVVEQSGVRSFPSMEYGFYGISVGGAVFHPKIVMVLGNERDNTESPVKKLFLFAGSNNLTKPGWWENIEVCTSLSFEQGDAVHPTTLNSLIATLDYLASNSEVNQKNSTTFDPFREFIGSLKSKETALEKGVYYFQQGRAETFPSFLANHLGKDFKTESIISPYFPEDDETDIVDAIQPAKTFNMYLPRTGTKALLTEGFYNHIKAKDGIWSDFIPTVSKELVPNDTVSRRLHAKLYSFAGNCTFIGSVNFTRKAFYENVEAGILFKSKDRGSKLLSLYTGEITFSTHDELHKKSSKEDDEKPSVNITLHFDWYTNHLSVYRSLTGESRGEAISATIQNNAGEELTTCEIAASKDSCTVTENLKKLASHLEKNSFVHVVAGDIKEDLYVHQSNWTHKRLDYPDLTLDEIIRIYVELNKKRDLTSRGSILIEAMYRMFQQSECAYGSEYTPAKAVKSDRSFFSEYAQIFYGFRRLNKLMEEKPDKQSYFLTSPRPDAFPALITSITDSEKSSIDDVSRYLVLLSVDEVYEKYASHAGDQRTKDVRKNIQDAVALLEKSLVEQVGGPPFLEWFKDQFFKEYTKAGNNE